MPRGFFHASTLAKYKAPEPAVPQCGKCGLYKGCNSPKMAASGEGKKKILLLAEAPGETEDSKGIQLCGNSGKDLEQTLRRLGINMRRDCILHNAVICRPPHNRDPKAIEIQACRPNLKNLLAQHKPKLIIPIGNAAIKSLIGGFWKEEVGSITKWVGRQIPDQTLNAWICPNWHPAFVLRENGQPFQKWYNHFYKETVRNCLERPWPEGPPNYSSQVTVELDPHKAANKLQWILERPGVVAFDYETNSLKPYHRLAKVLCFSICWEGKRTIATPNLEPARSIFRKLLLSKRHKKIAANLSFESNWTWRAFDCEVVNWTWDIIPVSHAMDNRKGTSGLKFQSYARLGQRSYDDHIKKLIRAKGSYSLNNLQREVEIKDLLLYNGMDSILTYIIAMQQAEELGVSL